MRKALLSLWASARRAFAGSENGAAPTAGRSPSPEAPPAQLATSNCQLVLRLAPSRSREGTDVGRIVRRTWPDAPLEAVIDERGAVQGYTVTLTYTTPEQCTEMARRLRAVCEELGFEVSVG